MSVKNLISKLMEPKKNKEAEFLLAAKKYGWFANWQHNGDVISKQERNYLQQGLAKHHIDKLTRCLEGDCRD